MPIYDSNGNIINNPGGSQYQYSADIGFTIDPLKTSPGSPIEKVSRMIDEARLLREESQALADASGSPWPNTLIDREPLAGEKLGFLSPLLLSPTPQRPFNASQNADDTRNLSGLSGITKDDPSLLKFDTGFEIPEGKVGLYEWTDWTGQKLARPDNLVKTEDRFKTHNDKLSNSELINERYSMRDFPLIFGDTSEDYFRFGLQTIDNLTPIENPENGESTLRLDNFKGTPWEQQDPVFYGFDIVFDAISSPLLNGSVLDFIANYTGVNEIASKQIVYDEFITQFKKFFRTNVSKSVPRILNPDSVALTKNKPHYTGYADSVQNTADLDGPASKFQPGKPAYLAHYIKKVGNLDLLIEANKGEAFKYITEWKKDMITITTTEDITLSMGTLAHLYKLLYWSKPQGKHIIPENLLRFNCDIIISEVRNMQRIRKNKQTQNIEVLKDNLSRWVFSLRECQFYFDKLPIENDVDMGAEPKMYEGYTFGFDFKYSTTKLERFMPAKDWGGYVGYDNGAIWKIGNSRGGTGSVPSVPEFLTAGKNTFNENGVTEPWVLSVIGDGSRESRAELTSGVIGLFKKSTNDTEVKAKEDAIALDAVEKTQNQKPGQRLASILGSAQFKKAVDFASDVTGISKISLQNKATATILSSPFFDIQGKMSGKPIVGKNKDSIANKLLNAALTKVYNAPKQAALNIVSNPPPASAFFDLRGQLDEFLGGPLARKFTKGDKGEEENQASDT